MDPRHPLPPIQDDPGVPPDLRRALSSYASLEPAASLRDQIYANLESELAVPAGPGELRRWKLVIAAGVLAGLGGMWMLAEAPRPIDEVVETPPDEAPAPQAVASPASVPPPAEEAEAPAAPPSIAPVTPSTARVQPPTSRGTQAKARAEARSRATTPEDELALLIRAKRLVTAKPAQALALTAQHRRLYATGDFAEEREVIAIEALVNLGRRTEAEESARGFRRAHPNSPHVGRLDVVLGRR